MAERDELFDLGVARALSYLKHTQSSNVRDIETALMPWYLKTRFVYRLSLKDISAAIAKYPLEAPKKNYAWQGGLEGAWQVAQVPKAKLQKEVEMAYITATGGCLCGQVRYVIHGELRGTVNCHCAKCRRFHGHYGAYTSADVEGLELLSQATLTWYHSISDETPSVHRGFCNVCGASLFWHPKDQNRIAIAAGSLDDASALSTIGHVWLSQKAGYYQICDDFPQFPKGWAAMTGSKEE